MQSKGALIDGADAAIYRAKQHRNVYAIASGALPCRADMCDDVQSAGTQ
ncbi:MAG: hypothetical protein ABI905_15020 [Betaproteobacteria bacterium]